MLPMHAHDAIVVFVIKFWPGSSLRYEPLVGSHYRLAVAVTARKDDAPAAVQAAIFTVAGLGSCSVGGGLIQTTSG